MFDNWVYRNLAFRGCFVVFDAYPQVELRLLFFIPSGDCIEVMVRRTIIAIAPVPPGGSNTPLKKPLRAVRVCRRHASAVRTEGRGGSLIEKCKLQNENL